MNRNDRDFVNRGRTHRLKTAALCGAVTLSLLLTGCYIPPDDVTDTGNLTVGSNNLPFATLVPTATVTPTAVVVTPSPTPAVPGTQQVIIQVWEPQRELAVVVVNMLQGTMCCTSPTSLYPGLMLY